jgi:DivIVA domain-containing protein
VDRQEIERNDFPSARRGYEPAAVREHLRRVADGFDELGRRPAQGSLAADASVRVQAIVEAAETSARALREDAEREAGQHVERVAAAARDLLERIDALRDGAASLSASLAALRDDAAALGTTPAEPVEAPPAANGARSADEAGARLVALNMALEGSPREATGVYLAEHYDLTDVDALLDDVYASAGK